MKTEKLLHYCPTCKHELDQNDRLYTCSSCGFHFYVNPAPCNAAILTDKDGKILLVERKLEPRKGYLDLPGGFIESGESVEESLVRELREELGIEATGFTYLASYADSYYYKGVTYRTLGIVFPGRIPEGAQIRAADDAASVMFFAPSEIPYDRIAFPSVERALKLFTSSS